MQRLKQHLPHYEKGAGGAFALTREHLAIATQRAKTLATKSNAYTAPEPYTAVADLVMLLTTLAHR